MNLKFKFLLVLTLSTITAFAQTLPSTAPAYNAPYDSLIAFGDKGVSSGLILGMQSPNMGMMFYNRAIEIEPENILAYVRKAKGYLDYNMLAEATEAYTQALDIDPTNINCIHGIFAVSAKGALSNYALEDVPLQMMKQVYNSAMAFIKVAPPTMASEVAYAQLVGYAFKLGIDNPDAYNKYCPLVKKGEVDGAMVVAAEELLPAVQTTGNNHVMATLYDKIAQYYFNQDNVAKTKEFGQKALTTGFCYSDTYYYLGYTYYYDDKNTTEAIKVLELGLKNKGEHEASSLLLAKILYREGKAAYHALNYPVSIEYLNKLVLSHPKNERAQAYLGFAYFNSKKYAEALKAFKVVKEVARPLNLDVYYPNFSALMTFAGNPTGTAPAVKMILLELEKYETIFDDGEKLRTEQNNEAALLKFEEALAYFTTINDKWNMEMSITCIGLCHQDLGNYEKAKEQYIKSINLGSDNEDPYANYALLLYAIDKNFDLAATILSQGLAKYPENETLFNVTGRMHIAKAYEFYNAEDYSGSIPHFENGLGYRNDARAYIFLGYAYNELSQVDKAVEAWDNAFYYDEALITEFQDVYDFVQSRK